jgi:hypothetical protein
MSDEEPLGIKLLTIGDSGEDRGEATTQERELEKTEVENKIE